MGVSMEIFAVDPREYSEEVIATAFAMTSRVPDDIRQSLGKLTDDKSAAFHEKWVVGYGHSSVAEHAVVHLGMEGVSRLAVDAVEANRLASYTEKSTRFQTIKRDNVVVTPEVDQSRWRPDFEAVHDNLFSAYGVALLALEAEVKRLHPRRDGEKSGAYDARVATIYRDVARNGLPFSVVANLGMTANARTWEYAISKWLSDPLPEVRRIGEAAKNEVLKVTPTLVKYANRSEYLAETRPAVAELVGRLFDENAWQAELFPMPKVEVVGVDKDGENRFLAAWLYRFGSGRSFAECMRIASGMQPDQKQTLIKESFERMGKFDSPGRELELPMLSFDLLLDAGSLYDFKRNRMMTQIQQEFEPELGFVLPSILDRLGVGEQMRLAISEAHSLSQAMRPEFSGEHRYLLTNASLRRVLMQMNLRELVAFWKTRGAGNTNPGYRYLALNMGEVGQANFPNIWEYMKAKDGDTYPTADGIYQNYFVAGGFGR